MSTISENYQRILERIEIAAGRFQRKPESVTVVAVIKTFPAEIASEAIAAGISHIGENRVQEAVKKKPAVSGKAIWHLVGHLQTNKVKKALEIFDSIDSVDSSHLAQEISKHAVNLGKEIPVLVQINTTGEQSKFGCEPDKALNLIREVIQLPGICLKGLMTIGRFSADPEEARHDFRLLKKIRDNALNSGIDEESLQSLSMGMSNDFEVAVEEGSTLVRIGTGIFGARK